MDRKEVASVIRALDLVSTLFSSMTAMIDKKRIHMDQKHENRMKTMTKKTKKTKGTVPKRCGSGYNLFVSTKVKKAQAVPVHNFYSLVIYALVYMTCWQE